MRYAFIELAAKLLLCSVCILVCSTRTAAAAATDVYISEFLADNATGTGLGQDEFGTTPDWIEIHNPGAGAVNLLGYFLTDDKLKPRKWAFPSTLLGPGARLVVYASNRNLANPLAPARLHTNFKLSAETGYLALTKADAGTPTETVFSEFNPYPFQFRDTSYGLTGSTVTYLFTPTPGGANSSPKLNIGPLIYNPTTKPPRPTGTAASPPMLITAEVQPSFRPIGTVNIAWRVLYNPEVIQPMVDNGTGGDSLAGDRVYSILIPTSTLTEGQMIRWRIIATDSASFATTAPTYPSPTDSDQYYGTVALTPSAQTNLPIVHTFFQDASGADGGGGTRGSMFFEGHFADNVFCSIHGQSTQGFAKKSYGWNFNNGYDFPFWPNAQPVKGINLLSNWADKSKVHNTLACEFIRASGARGHLAFPVRVHRTAIAQGVSGFFSIADALEQGDECYLQRAGLDPDGAFYKIYNPMTSASGNEKKTRKNEPFDDLQNLINNLDESILLQTRRRYAYDNLDIPQCISYFVALALVSSQDHGHKNFYVYRDTNASGNWALLPWDVDLTWGRNWTGQYFDDTIYGNNVLSFIYNYSGNDRLYNIFHNSPEFKKMYMRRLRTVMDTILQQNTSPNNIIETRIRELLDQMDPPAIGTSDADLDYAKWGSWGNGNNMRTEAARITVANSTGHLFGRRNFLYTQNPTINGEPIPAIQAAHPPITLEAYDSNPVSGNQDQEYITLKNPSPINAVDISGWKLDGGIRYTFPAGTVLAPFAAGTENLGLLFAAKNIKAFRQRSLAPTANQFCYVVGPYEGQMSGRGEVIRLLDAAGELVFSKTIAPNPTPSQVNLRITELNYAPLPPTAAELAAMPNVVASDFEFFELTNFGASTLDLSGAVISSGVNFTFPPASSLAPGQRIVIAGNVPAFRMRYGQTPQVAGYFTGNLDNTGESLELVDKVGEKVLDFTWDGTWHPLTNGGGYSMALRSPTIPYDQFSLPTTWAVSGWTGGSPGVADPYFSMTYESWRHDYFTIAEQLDPLIAGKSVDGDGDGKTNFVEYQMGGNPKVADFPPPVEWQVANDAGTDYGAISFNRRAHALDLLLVVEAAVDPALSSWTPTGTLVGTAVALSDGTEKVVFRDSVPLAQARRVLRVKDLLSGEAWIAKVPQSISFATVGDFPYQPTPLALNVSANSGLPVTLAVVSGPGQLNGNLLTITGTGAIEISANQAGNAGYMPADEVVQTINVLKADQSISFANLNDRLFTFQPITLSAQASSGLPAALTVVSGPATINANALTLTGIGAITVRASQDGNDLYMPAPNEERTFNVAAAPQAINFTNVGNKTYLNAPFNLNATSSVGLPVTFKLISGPGSIAGNKVTILGAGTIVVDAEQAGDMPRVAAADTVRQTIVVNKASVTISWPQPADVSAGTPLSSGQLNAVATDSLQQSVTGTFTYSPPAGTELQRSDSVPLSVVFTPNDSANYEAASASTSLRVVNGGPQFVSPPSVLGGVAIFGVPISFAAQASDADNDGLTYVWDFGDGSTGAGGQPSHVYAAPGVYLVSVTVSDGMGGTQTSTMSVHVNRELSVAKATVKLNFQKQNADAITASGIMQFPAGTSAAGKTVSVSIGSQVETATLDFKGKAKTGKLSISVAAPKGGISKFSLTWSKSTFQLAPMGYVNDFVKNKAVTLPLQVEVSTDTYQGVSPMVYTATKAKKGAAKLGVPR